MNIPIMERRQIENEMIFRRLNEKIGDELDRLDAMHIEDGNLQLLWDDTILLNFRCECSNEKCDEKIPVKLSFYKQIHENRNAFIIKHGHNIKSIERVILSEDGYRVVQKNNSTAEPDDTLNDTSMVHV